MRQRYAFGLFALTFAIAAAATEAPRYDPKTGPALAVVERFEQALAAGDRDTALAQLAPDLVVFESGHAERSRDEYAASHLDADIAFLKTATTRQTARRASADTDSALVLSESEVRSERNGKTTTRATLETLVLRRRDGRWQITHIHWSSRAIETVTGSERSDK